MELLLKCTINILGQNVDVNICKDNTGIYSFELSDFLQNEDDVEPYKPGGGSTDSTLDGLFVKLERYYKNRFTKIINKVPNPNFK